jgi:hypothetical protein
MCLEDREVLIVGDAGNDRPGPGQQAVKPPGRSQARSAESPLGRPGAAGYCRGAVTGTEPRIISLGNGARMVAQAEQEAAVLMEQEDPGDPGITRRDLEDHTQGVS